VAHDVAEIVVDDAHGAVLVPDDRPCAGDRSHERMACLDPAVDDAHVDRAA
jgi:hypothetical protein